MIDLLYRDSHVESFSLVWRLWGVCSSVSARPQRPWARAPIRAKVWLDPKWICTWRLCQTSIHLRLPPARGSTSRPPPPTLRQADRWTARAQAECFWRGWVGDIDSMSTVLGERGGQWRFSYKANSGPISSHILSGDFSSFFFTFSPFSFPPTLCLAFVLCFIFILLKEKRKKKTRSTKVVLPAVNRGRGGGGGVQIAL